MHVYIPLIKSKKPINNSAASRKQTNHLKQCPQLAEHFEY